MSILSPISTQHGRRAAAFEQALGHIVITGESPMDDYVEELLEYHADERDPAEPAEDATEL
jgi:hypothetical protein